MTTRTITLEVTDLTIELLRRWIDEAPSNPYVPMVASVLPQLPQDTQPEACDRYLDYMRRNSAAIRSCEHPVTDIGANADGLPECRCGHVLTPESVAARSSADSAPAGSQVPESAGGFQLRAWTPSGKEALPDILRRLLATTPTPTYFPTDCKPHGESL